MDARRWTCLAVMVCLLTSARAITMAEEFATFDWLSFAITLGAAGVGGVVRSIWVLGDQQTIVRNKPQQFLTDCITSIIAGGGLYLALIAWEAYSGNQLPNGTRIPAAILVGWTRRLFIGWLASIVETLSDGIINRVREWSKKPSVAGQGD